MKTSSILFILILFSGCKKFVQVPAPDFQLSTENVFSSEATAEAALAGIYSSLWDKGYYVSLYAGLSADEFDDFSFSSVRVEFNQNGLSASNAELSNFWSYFYSSIYQCNSVINGLNKNNGVPDLVKKQLVAESLTLRAFCYYYLVNFWGAVPLVLSTDYISNAKAVRVSPDSVYLQVLKDLGDAEPDLPVDFANMERARITRWADLAIQARIYASLKNWTKVEEISTEIIGQSLFSLPGDPDSVFLRNSPEAIWQLEPQDPNFSTYEASQYILNSTPTVQALDSVLLQSFEAGDLRKTDWIGFITVDATQYGYPFKYKDKQSEDPLREYAMALRLGEQYLLRAEARAEQNNFPGSLADINILRRRAGLADQTGASLPELLTEITGERERELFSEWGDRWIFLKRTGQVDATLSIEKPGWTPDAALFPIPLAELNNDPWLTQNTGY